ncbi:MAG: amidohydrolase family protein [Planctomycetota bacterium]|nr:amidohydrolase family protein [Planctomycetota bacterium]
MPAIIDTHQHFWDLDRFQYRWLSPDIKVLFRNYLPVHLEPLLKKAGVGKTLIVQALGEMVENDWSLELAARNPFIAGVVGWIDIYDPGFGKELVSLRTNPNFKGIRLGVNKQMLNDRLVRREVVLAVKSLAQAGLSCDLLVHAENLVIVRTLASAFPDVPFIVNHLGNPPLRSGPLDEWAAKLRSVAKFPNVTCKLSGLVTLCDLKTWSPEQLKPAVKVAVEAFGYDRLMFGSDWPVCLMAAPYQDVLDAAVEALGPISEADKAKVFSENARRVYRLG